MNQYQFDVVAHHRPEVLERLLRVIRHRGFRVTALQMQLDDDKVRLNIAVKSERTWHLLVNQLVKLYDVITVEKTAEFIE